MIPRGRQNQITDQGLFALKTGNTFMFLIFHEGTILLTESRGSAVPQSSSVRGSGSYCYEDA